MTAVINKNCKLKSGYEIPILGLGTWELKGKRCEDVILRALELGYRHIDTAELYENENEIGRAIKGFNRASLFITSKAASKNFSQKDVLKACERSLENLGTDYIDLYLLHWPNEEVPLAETLEAMLQLVDKSFVRSIGLSNFDFRRIKKAMSISKEPISNLQIEYHPFTKWEELPEFCRKEGIVVTAYSPLARGKVFDDSDIIKIAEKYDKSAAQISLKWLVQKGNVVIPKASSEKHLRENMQIFDWELSDEDLGMIDNVKKQKRLVDSTYT